jgi:hypothetical protein
VGLGDMAVSMCDTSVWKAAPTAPSEPRSVVRPSHEAPLLTVVDRP